MDTTLIDNMPELALEWHRAGQGAVLATVIETWGSAPRPVGSQLAIAGDGRMMGSVSGGCVEGAVIEGAMEALADGLPRLLTFGVSDENAFAVGLACGGTIRILVLPIADRGLPPDLLAQITKARAARQPIAHRTSLTDWSQSLEGPEALADRFRADLSGIEDQDFIHIHNPPLRMAVVGAVHIAQGLLPMARACGYDVILIDPREAFGADHRFPGVTISHDWPDEALARFALDARSAVVTLTHDAKLDDPAIIAALGSQAFYLGCLGSRRTHEKRLARLQAAGVSPDQIARIHAPVGLAIGAKSPAEIAVSIMAEVTRALRQGGQA
jgi:xanthine dehydrogenase accessory factor